MEENDVGIPYWITNEDWYYYDDEGEVHIKEDAPKKAKESFKEFQAEDDG